MFGQSTPKRAKKLAPPRRCNEGHELDHGYQQPDRNLRLLDEFSDIASEYLKVPLGPDTGFLRELSRLASGFLEELPKLDAELLTELSDIASQLPAAIAVRVPVESLERMKQRALTALRSQPRTVLRCDSTIPDDEEEEEEGEEDDSHDEGEVDGVEAPPQERTETKPGLFIVPLPVAVPALPITLPVDTTTHKASKAYLSDFEMGEIIRMKQEKLTYREISDRLGRRPGVCQKFYARYTKRHKFRAAMGRPNRIPEKTTDAIVAATEEDHRLSLRKTAARDDVQVSPSSVRVQRRKKGYGFYRSIPVPPLTPRRRQTRVQFCKWQDEHWTGCPIIFTDESMVAQDLNQGGLWRRRGEMLAEGTYDLDHHPIAVMVWGAIGPNYRSKLIRCPPSVNGVSYKEMLESNNVIEKLNARFGPRRYVWQQDNAPSHRKAWKGGLSGQVNGFASPPYSPDLSPIEHMWAIIKRQLKGMRFSDKDELFEAISAAWDSIDTNVVNDLVKSFRARCRVCVELNGASLNAHWKRVAEVGDELANPRPATE
jgi:transposase